MNILRSFFRHIFFSLSVNVELYTETGCTVEGKKKKMMEKNCESFNVCFTYHRIERNKKCFLRMIFISQMKCVDLKKAHNIVWWSTSISIRIDHCVAIIQEGFIWFFSTLSSGPCCIWGEKGCYNNCNVDVGYEWHHLST